MANVLSEGKRQQVIALGHLGWTLRRIEAETGIRHETVSAYLKAAGIAVRRKRGRRLPPKAASQVSTDPAAAAPLINGWPPRPAKRTQASRREPDRAFTAMLDRMLHHGYVLKCGPKSWRRKNLH